MPYIKSEDERKIIKQGGKIISDILSDAKDMIEPGISVAEIDEKVESEIVEAGGSPVFKGYQPDPTKEPFPNAVCASVNEEVVHGLANQDKVLESGDIISLDVGMEWPVEESKQNIFNPHSTHGGYITDTAFSMIVGEDEQQASDLLDTTQKALYEAIQVVQPGNTVADIGKRVEEVVKPSGYGIVKSLCGHGVGHEIHEEPNVFNFHTNKGETKELKEGVVLAIEPMLIQSGNHEVKTGDNDWSIVSKDGSLSAHFEHDVIVEQGGPTIVTKREDEEIL